jgi:hypothetical protein
LRVKGRLHHIGIGRAHAQTHVLILAHDLDVRVIDAATGELLRELIIDGTRDYQPRRTPTRPNSNTPNLIWVRGDSDVLRHHSRARGGIRTHDLSITSLVSKVLGMPTGTSGLVRTGRPVAQMFAVRRVPTDGLTAGLTSEMMLPQVRRSVRNIFGGGPAWSSPWPRTRP